jgi:hypothetical protein
MPGIRKREICRRLRDHLLNNQCEVSEESDVGLNGLPWVFNVRFSDGSTREFFLYVWTIAHGGKTRADDEYRIQIKLEKSRSLRVGKGTTILLGYYSEKEDSIGKMIGHRAPPGLEILVAWDAIEHLHIGASSSCQVLYPLMYDAYLRGRAEASRQLTSGAMEHIVAFRPEFLASYLKAASGGHYRVHAGLTQA